MNQNLNSFRDIIAYVNSLKNEEQIKEFVMSRLEELENNSKKRTIDKNNNGRLIGTISEGYINSDSPIVTSYMVDPFYMNDATLYIEFIKSIELDDLHKYLNYLSKILSDKPTTRARKVATLKSFFNFLTHKKKILDKNPAVELETPKLPKRLPKYLSLDESLSLLHSVDGEFEKRDLCILTLFLNCGLRLSELVNINMYHIRGDILTVIGKGDKERSIYLNDACQKAIKEYIAVRPKDVKERDALFISKRGTRIGKRTVEVLVKKYIIIARFRP